MASPNTHSSARLLGLLISACFTASAVAQTTEPAEVKPEQTKQEQRRTLSPIDQAKVQGFTAMLQGDYVGAQRAYRLCQGDVECDYRLGMFARRDVRLGGTNVEAYQHLLRAGQKGHARSMYWLGYIITGDQLVGLGDKPRRDWMNTRDYDWVPKPQQGFEWYKRGAEAGDNFSTCHYGSLMHPALNPTYPQMNKSREEAMVWIRKAAGMQAPFCLYVTGSDYKDKLPWMPEVEYAFYLAAMKAFDAIPPYEIGAWERPADYQGMMNHDIRGVKARLTAGDEPKVATLTKLFNSGKDVTEIVKDYSRDPIAFMAVHGPAKPAATQFPTEVPQGSHDPVSSNTGRSRSSAQSGGQNKAGDSLPAAMTFKRPPKKTTNISLD